MNTILIVSFLFAVAAAAISTVAVRRAAAREKHKAEAARSNRVYMIGAHPSGVHYAFEMAAQVVIAKHVPAELVASGVHPPQKYSAIQPRPHVHAVPS